MEQEFDVKNDKNSQNFNDGQMTGVNPPLCEAGGLAFSASAVLMIIISAVVAFIISLCQIAEGSDAYTYLRYLAAPVAMTLGVIFSLKVRKVSPKKMLRFKCNPKYYAIAVLLIFGLIFFASDLDGVFLELFKLMGYKPQEASSYFPTLTGGYVVLALLVMAVMPAVFEEFLFRGVILNTCEEELGSIRTVFIVGFCFSLFHASPEQTVYQFLAGCAFAFLALRSGSILPSVLMHFINNALIVILAACNLFDRAGELMMPFEAMVTVKVFAALSLIGAAIWLGFDRKPYKKGDRAKVKNFFIYASVGIVILGLMWVLSFFVV